MKRLGAFALLSGLLVTCSGGGGPIRPHPPEFIEVPGYYVASVAEDFAGGVRANVIVSGNMQAYLGVYVFDALGNCVAWDDFGNRATYDDLNAEWYPPVAGRYGIDVYNFGRFESQAELAFP
ncbi:MAG: hypothetical protein HY040_00795 [Planctomycetes bacterium]|nr:hypothetical protein [Planctomycetota bacterium]